MLSVATVGYGKHGRYNKQNAVALVGAYVVLNVSIGLHTAHTGGVYRSGIVEHTLHCLKRVSSARPEGRCCSAQSHNHKASQNKCVI